MAVGHDQAGDSDRLDHWFDLTDRDEEEEGEDVGKLLARLKARWDAERAAWQAQVNTLYQRAITAEAARDQLMKALRDLQLQGAGAGTGTVPQPHQAAPGQFTGGDFLLQADASFPIHGVEPASVFGGLLPGAGVHQAPGIFAATEPLLQASESPFPIHDDESTSVFRGVLQGGVGSVSNQSPGIYAGTDDTLFHVDDFFAADEAAPE